MASQTSHSPFPNPSARARLALLFPAQGGHNGSKAPLIAGPYAIARRSAHWPRLTLVVGRWLHLVLERADEHLQQAHAGLAGQILANNGFPWIALITGGLLWHGVFKLEVSIRPPHPARAVERDRFGEELVAVFGETIDVDRSAFERPEPAATGFVA